MMYLVANIYKDARPRRDRDAPPSGAGAGDEPAARRPLLRERRTGSIGLGKLPTGLLRPRSSEWGAPAWLSPAQHLVYSACGRRSDACGRDRLDGACARRPAARCTRWTSARRGLTTRGGWCLCSGAVACAPGSLIAGSTWRYRMKLQIPSSGPRSLARKADVGLLARVWRSTPEPRPRAIRLEQKSCDVLRSARTSAGLLPSRVTPRRPWSGLLGVLAGPIGEPGNVRREEAAASSGTAGGAGFVSQESDGGGRNERGRLSPSQHTALSRVCRRPASGFLPRFGAFGSRTPARLGAAPRALT